MSSTWVQWPRWLLDDLKSKEWREVHRDWIHIADYDIEEDFFGRRPYMSGQPANTTGAGSLRNQDHASVGAASATKDVEPLDPTEHHEQTAASTTEEDVTTRAKTYRQYIAECRAYDDHPENAKDWLLTCGISTSDGWIAPTFAAVEDAAPDDGRQDSSPYISLLPLFTTWLNSWSTGPNARKNKNEDSLNWLLACTAEYLGLPHQGLDGTELHELIKSVLNICSTSVSKSNIDSSFRVLNTILSRWPFPREVLRSTLEILCIARAALHRNLPADLIECWEVLWKGPHGLEVYTLVLEFLKTLPDNVTDKRANLARGATCFIRNSTWIQMQEIGMPGQLETLFASLLRCAEAGLTRVNTEILDLCFNLLVEPRWQREIFDKNLGIFLDVIGKAESTNDPLQELADPADTTTRRTFTRPTEEHHEVHDRSTRRVKGTLTLLWPELPHSQRRIVYEYFLDHPKLLDQKQITTILFYAFDRHFYRAAAYDVMRNTERLLTAFVRFTDLPSAGRVQAIEMFGQHLQNVPDVDHPERETLLRNLTAMSIFVIQIWLNQVEVEKDPVVLNALLNALRIAATYNIEQYDSNPRLETIVPRLEELAMADPRQNRKTTSLATSATRTLVDIFLDAAVHVPIKCLVAFKALLNIASRKCQVRLARLEAMRTLFRLRCDSSGAMYSEGEMESEYIAAALCRTRASADQFSGDAVDIHRQSPGNNESNLRSQEALWMYPTTEDIAGNQGPYAIRGPGYATRTASHTEMDMVSWLFTITDCLQRETDWEIYSYVIVHAGAQLANIKLFSGSLGCLESVVKLRQVLCSQINHGKFSSEPPAGSGLKKSDIAICLFNVLTPLIAYATLKADAIQKGFADDVFRTFLSGVGGTWEGTSRGCIHALSICCLELPDSVASAYPVIVDKMSKSMTQAHLTMHILEFLAQAAKFTELHSNFRDEEIGMIFSICIQFLEKARERNTSSSMLPPSRLGTPSTTRHSGFSSKRPPYRAAMLSDPGIPQYTSALAYHTMLFWFLSIKLKFRANLVPWIIPRLTWNSATGEETIDEQSEVLIDMMQRTAFSDLGETLPSPDFATASDGPVSSTVCLVDMSIVTVETAGRTGLTQITKRQASGTTYSTYKQNTSELPPHQIPTETGIVSDNSAGVIEMLPSHVMLQLTSTAMAKDVSSQPIVLPREEDWVKRALNQIDRLPTTDSHKIGVLYLQPGQVEEKEYLANTSGSADYQKFLSGLGTAVSLAPPLRFNPQGLQQSIDGETTLAWRDRLTEITWLVTTMMPNNLSDDPACTQKKSHVGNCFVNIVFNSSDLKWRMEQFQSQFNNVNIVVTPANRSSSVLQDSSTSDFYRVHVLTAPNFPAISPAADPKIISAAQLPQFVRTVALNANVFSHAWNVRETDNEFRSSWRARLQAIKQLRERVRKNQGEGGSREGDLARRLDFSRWTL